jgi:N6-adenosine-specific RNA methylase IME4
MQKHKLNLYPEITGEAFERLKEKLAKGYDKTFPIILHEGAILDGWNRYRACKELGIEPATKEFHGTDEQAMEFVFKSNERRDLTASQRAVIALEYLPLIEAEAKKRQVRTEENRMKGKNLVHQQIDEQAPKQQSLEVASDKFGSNRQYISDAKKIAKEAPQYVERIKAGDITISEVKKEMKNTEKQKEIEKIKVKISNDNKVIIDKYDVVILDPPWNYGRKYDADGSRVASPYPEQTRDEIADTCKGFFKDNCVLWLWTTHQFMWEAKELIDLWGFEYKACLVWNKERLGMGAWLRMQCEFCLLAVKGNPIYKNTTEIDIINEARREHSRKPVKFYDVVKKTCFGSIFEYYSREEKEGIITGGIENGKLA